MRRVSPELQNLHDLAVKRLVERLKDQKNPPSAAELAVALRFVQHNGVTGLEGAKDLAQNMPRDLPFESVDQEIRS